MDRRLQVIEQVITCDRCELYKGCASPVPMYGKTPNRIAIIGEAPGAQEDLVGQPFIGPAGKMIRKHLVEVGIDPDEDVTWLNTASCFPHGTPESEHIEACAKNKRDQLEVIAPDYVLLLGKVALRAQRGGIEMKRVRGRPFLVDGRVNFPTYHPSAALRNGNFEQAMAEDLATFKQLIDSGDWTKHISDKCAACGQWMVWITEDGLPWCELDAPKEYGDRQALLRAEYEQAHRRLNPIEPEQLSVLEA